MWQLSWVFRRLMKRLLNWSIGPIVMTSTLKQSSGFANRCPRQRSSPIWSMAFLGRRMRWWWKMFAVVWPIMKLMASSYTSCIWWPIHGCNGTIMKDDFNSWARRSMSRSSVTSWRSSPNTLSSTGLQGTRHGICWLALCGASTNGKS